MPRHDDIDPTVDWEWAKQLIRSAFPPRRRPEQRVGGGIPVPWGELAPQHDLEELDRDDRPRPD